MSRSSAIASVNCASSSRRRSSLPRSFATSNRDLGRLARAGHDVVGLLAGLLQPLAVLLQKLVGLLALALGRLDVLPDRIRALLEGLLDPRERDLAQHPHREEEQDERPDHQAETGRNQEAPPT